MTKSIVYHTFVLSGDGKRYLAVGKVPPKTRINTLVSGARKLGTSMSKTRVAPWIIGLNARGEKPTIELLYEGTDKEKALAVYHEKAKDGGEWLNTSFGAGRIGG